MKCMTFYVLSDNTSNGIHLCKFQQMTILFVLLVLFLVTTHLGLYVLECGIEKVLHLGER